VTITVQLKIRCEVRPIVRGHHHGFGGARGEPSPGLGFEKAQEQCCAGVNLFSNGTLHGGKSRP
jgi:hypothetical protein